MTTPLYGHAMTGYDDGRPGETPSLQEASQLWSEAASRASTTPRSVLQQVQLSPGNGRSERDAQRVLPGGWGVLSTSNGMSEQASAGLMPLKMAGDVAL